MMLYSQYRIIIQIVFLISVTLFNNIVNGMRSSPCVLTRDEGNFAFANCKNLNLTEIPTNLPASIQVLDMTDNPLTNIRNDSFKYYSSLINFIYRQIPGRFYQCEIDADAFEMTSLKSLDLGSNPIGPELKLKLPHSIINLRLDHANLTLESLVLSDLPNLKRVVLSDNNLTAFPAFSATAALYLIDLSNNPIDSIGAETLAKYCELEHLFFNIQHTWPMLKNLNCSCTRLKKWFIFRGIKGTNMKSFDCMNESQCDVNKEMEQLKAVYVECWIRKSRNKKTDDGDNDFPITPDTDSSLSTLYVVISAFLLSILIAGVCFIVYKKRKARSRNEIQNAKTEEGGSAGDENESYYIGEENEE